MRAWTYEAHAIWRLRSRAPSRSRSRELWSSWRPAIVDYSRSARLASRRWAETHSSWEKLATLPKWTWCCRPWLVLLWLRWPSRWPWVSGFARICGGLCNQFLVLLVADRAGLQQKDVLEVLELTEMSSKMIVDKGNGIGSLYYRKHINNHLNSLQQSSKANTPQTCRWCICRKTWSCLWTWRISWSSRCLSLPPPTKCTSMLSASATENTMHLPCVYILMI